MIELARQEAEGLDTISFCVGDIVDMSRFADASFDLVLCLDSPLSFCFRDHERALDELVRVCRDDLVVCAMSRLGTIAEGGMAFDRQHFGVPRTVWEVLETGDLDITDELLKLQPLMPSWHAFTARSLGRRSPHVGSACAQLWHLAPWPGSSRWRSWRSCSVSPSGTPDSSTSRSGSTASMGSSTSRRPAAGLPSTQSELPKPSNS